MITLSDYCRAQKRGGVPSSCSNDDVARWNLRVRRDRKRPAPKADPKRRSEAPPLFLSSRLSFGFSSQVMAQGDFFAEKPRISAQRPRAFDR